ncbi:acetyl-CoA carboxylase biotin carboxylase subunit [Sporomusa acidovorans]|uniref:Biotin carboxylase n=1 Tax=Sporomusa acidovorans (strain ATCC 49682 / DSM 3132 / Mol) TaxID=1123286 RepID=A0ABZ3J9N3_SPOA4|nr:acetyl-CoA carboxylase biotin carboxylase subunit [Sporomusa acidovorans]OZC16196.1 biotin carboxylase [Sporomusa acidovorans DSM 3132]SDE30903.1 acetyl-CoA carboxylase, biotin carboxylase subunit [Sporomusa acidovorans]
MFKRLLIANRGEIAVRIIRACQELGVETVAVYSDVDADALHVQLADCAYLIGPADASQSYLNIDAIIAAAKATHADAIHPGYGFLSENADFAEKVTNSGLVFVGPRAETIRKVGNKDAAREAMTQAGLPMATGSDPVRNATEACRIADEIGYPVIMKPVSGGGGKSIYVANNTTELISAVNKVDLTTSIFYLEKYIADARHIEVQIVADNYGHIIHLGERECSLQRRNQKILEEAPSSALSAEMRQKVGSLAIRAAKSVHYTNVGTVEFLMDKNSGDFYFMEINPRIQVEHAITEAITGIDLVRKQLRIAAGEPLNVKQEDVTFTGHAIECRINAEDPAQNFLPSPGQITFYHQPGGPKVRVDSGVCAGSVVQPYYDSLIAKVIVRGRSRGEAIKVMQRALGEFRISGIKTTIDFHLEVLKDPYFCSGDIDTQFIYKRMIS